MATQRGFVLKIDVGRGGLVTATILFEDGNTGQFVIEDLDADPERFNERLSMLAILRDAMDRAEPVEFQSEKGEAGQVFTRVARLSRDSLGSPLKIETVTGLVTSAVLFTENRPSTPSEKADVAKIRLVTVEKGANEYVLDMQTPERAVAAQQFELLRTAQQDGQFVRLYVESSEAKTDRLIYGVAILYGSDPIPSAQATEVSGFVEALSLIPLSIGSDVTANFALVRFTTAPEFKGDGGTIGLDPFMPITLNLLTPKGSLAYQLFEAGLRDNLRMKVRAMQLYQKKTDESAGARKTDESKRTAAAKNTEYVYTNFIAATTATTATAATATGGTRPDNLCLVFSAELLAHLASASRPVWVSISRQSLDHGPDGYGCTPGVPSSDLTPRTLRDLRIPYPAEWCGIGCFNPGIYCFQFKLPTDFELFIDGKEQCLYDSTKTGIKMGYACLDGCHRVCVKIKNWVCDYEFIMDVYQIR